MQDDLPARVPDIIAPSSDKINIEKLRSDITKYFSSRVFTEETKKWWKDFLADKEGLFSATEKPHVWLLDEVEAIKRRQTAVSEEEPQEQQGLDDERSTVADLPQRPLAAPKDLEDMVVGQLTEVPQVYENKIVFSMDVDYPQPIISGF